MEEILKGVGIKSYELIQETIPLSLSESDFAITFQTSGSYYPLIYGLPCIHILKYEYLNQPLFNIMERNLKRIITNIDDLPGLCQSLIEDLMNQRSIPNDAEHMRKFYPDGATNLIIEQIESYLE